MRMLVTINLITLVLIISNCVCSWKLCSKVISLKKIETKYFISNNKYNYNNGKKMYAMSSLSSNANFMTMSNKMILEEVTINAITFLQRIFITLYQFLKVKFMKTNYLNTDNRCFDKFYVINDVVIRNDPCNIIDVINVDILSMLAVIINYNFQMELKQQQSTSSSQSSASSLVVNKKYWPVGIRNKKNTTTSPPVSSSSPPLSSHYQIISPTPEDPFENELLTTSNVVDVGLKVIVTNQPILETKMINDQNWTPHQMIKKPSS